MDIRIRTENAYDNGDETTATITVEIDTDTLPEDPTDTQALDDWANDHLTEYTGDGEHPSCEATYGITIIEAPEPFDWLTDKYFEWQG